MEAVCRLISDYFIPVASADVRSRGDAEDWLRRSAITSGKAGVSVTAGAHRIAGAMAADGVGHPIWPIRGRYPICARSSAHEAARRKTTATAVFGWRRAPDDTIHKWR